jgi:EamA domain-containing membrane protein RarD
MNPLLAGASVLFLAFLVFYVLWGFFIIYHLLRFSPRKEIAVAGSVVFVVVTVFILLVGFASFQQVDTDAPLRLPREILTPQF